MLDDCTRFCIASSHVPDQTLAAVWSVLWDSFLAFGLPDAVLSDNGSAFRNNATWRWSSFDLKLMLLGIRPTHGRPYHPQTQGKVERFQGTMERELTPFLVRPAPLQPMLETFRTRYNWIRPHEALGMRTPGSVYEPSNRKRPATMPAPFFPDGSIPRKCDDQGIISYKAQRYKLGRSFSGQPVGLHENQNGVLCIVWASFTLAPLEDFKV